MFWQWDYTIQIMEERPDGTIAWIFEKTVHNLKEAYAIASNIIDKMTGMPYGVTIYKDWKNRTIPTTPFEWGNQSFHIVDFYL